MHTYSLENLAFCQNLVHLLLGGDFCLRHHFEGIEDFGLCVDCQHHLGVGRIAISEFKKKCWCINVNAEVEARS